ncbi:MAG: apolipoprotein N-acyltransferase [Vampirovibrionales bacterium]|nr:apolipoprotein N-acyltransferase [Vampirovibrionales bacterium]
MPSIKEAFRRGRKRGGAALTMPFYGALAGFTSAGWPLWPLAWIALIPLMRRLQTTPSDEGHRKTLARAAIAGAGFGFGYHLSALFWTNSLHPLTWLGLSLDQSRAAALGMWLTWATLGAFLWAILAMAHRAIAPPQARWTRRLAAALAWGAILLAYSALNELYPPWTLLCYGQAASPLALKLAGALQDASPWGFDALIVWVNAELARGWRLAQDRRYSGLRLAVISAALPALAAGSAIWPQTPTDGDLPTPLAVAQGNLSIETIRASSTLTEASEAAYLTPLKQARWPRGTLIALPEEGPAPEWISLRAPQRHEVARKWTELAKSRGWRIISGAATMDEGWTARYYNSVIQIDSRGGFQAFHKRRLVPIGESTPRLGGLLPENWLSEVMRVLGAPPYENLFAAGARDQTLLQENGESSSTNATRIGPLVCLELAYPQLSADERRAGARLLINVSNLGWFHGDRLMAAQFLAMGQFRAAENHLPLAIAANDGPSAIIDAQGRVLALAPSATATTLFAPGRLKQIPKQAPKQLQ